MDTLPDKVLIRISQAYADKDFFPFNIVSLFNQYKCCTRPLKNVLKDMQRQDDNLCSTFMKQPQFGYIALMGRRAKTNHKIIVLIIIPTVIRCFFLNCDQKMNTSHHECASYLHISLHNADRIRPPILVTIEHCVQ